MQVMRTAASAAIVAVAGLASALSASASVIPTMSVEEVFDASDIVVHGRVTAQESKWEKVNGNRLIFTYTDVEVFSSLKSRRPTRTMKVRTVGGSVDGYNQALIGEAAIRPGEEVVLFLGKEPGWDRPSVVGFFQGKYEVDHTGAMGTHMVRDQGAEAGNAPNKVDRFLPADEFMSELNRIANRGPDNEKTQGLVPLTKQVGSADMQGEMAVFARTIARGTHATDINADGVLDYTDVAEFADAYVNGGHDADVNADGVVDLADLTRLIEDLNQ